MNVDRSRRIEKLQARQKRYETLAANDPSQWSMTLELPVRTDDLGYLLALVQELEETRENADGSHFLKECCEAKLRKTELALVRAEQQVKKLEDWMRANAVGVVSFPDVHGSAVSPGEPPE